MTARPYRIIFMGTPDFAVPALRSLIAGPDTVVAVVTQPDKRKGRGKKLAPPPVKVVAEEAGIDVLQPTKVRTEEFLETLGSYQPDLIVVIAYGRILPLPVLQLPPLGCINVHGSLLPRHRGAAPIQWAIINGDQEVGVTIMQMDEGMDTGDILLPRAIAADRHQTAGELFTRLSELGATALMEALDLLQAGTLQAIPQDHSLATSAPPLTKETGCIDWTKTADEIHCLIRGLDPWPTAYTFLNSKRVRFFSPEVVHRDSDQPPGTVLMADKQGVLVATGKNCLLLREIQPEGKKRMVVEAFLCGHSLDSGCRFLDH